VYTVDFLFPFFFFPQLCSWQETCIEASESQLNMSRCTGRKAFQLRVELDVSCNNLLRTNSSHEAWSP
jgi:hypothetical protein